MRGTVAAAALVVSLALGWLWLPAAERSRTALLSTPDLLDRPLEGASGGADSASVRVAGGAPEETPDAVPIAAPPMFWEALVACATRAESGEWELVCEPPAIELARGAVGDGDEARFAEALSRALRSRLTGGEAERSEGAPRVRFVARARTGRAERAGGAADRSELDGSETGRAESDRAGLEGAQPGGEAPERAGADRETADRADSTGADSTGADSTGADSVLAESELVEPERVEPERAPIALRLRVSDDDALELHFTASGGRAGHARLAGWRSPGRESLLPPLLAIVLAVLTRRPVLSLFCGVLAGAWLLRLGSPEPLPLRLLEGALDVGRVFLWREFSDPGRWKVIGFVALMLSMVGIVTKNGGIRGLMDLVARFARGARSTQVASFGMGLCIFFDDYANTILVGSTMRPLCDRFRVAREKLAYIVDSTAAPVAGLSIFSTWIAFEVSTYSAQLPLAGLRPEDGYAIFIETLPYRFYSWLTLAMVALVCVTGRDFGPMLAAERRARRTGRLVREGGRPMVADSATAMEPVAGLVPRAWRALVPLALFVGGTLWTILETGGAFAPDGPALLSVRGLTEILGGADSYEALWRGSLLGCLAAVLASLVAGLRREIVDAAWKTLVSMGVALAILYLAWMIGAVCAELGTARYLTALLEESLSPSLLPLVLFVLSGAIAFATGSSWSTMSILLPLVVGLAFGLGERCELGGHLLLLLSIGAVLEGAIFGDHCSPISDTTVLSSVACASDHIDHVRTQAPYAGLTMLVALVCGYLAVSVLGLAPGVGLAAGVLVIAAALRWLGARVDEEGDRAPSEPAATAAGGSGGRGSGRDDSADGA